MSGSWSDSEYISSYSFIVAGGAEDPRMVTQKRACQERWPTVRSKMSRPQTDVDLWPHDSDHEAPPCPNFNHWVKF